MTIPAEFSTFAKRRPSAIGPFTPPSTTGEPPHLVEQVERYLHNINPYRYVEQNNIALILKLYIIFSLLKTRIKSKWALHITKRVLYSDQC